MLRTVLLTAILGTATLAACSPKAAPVATSTPKPTLAPVATATSEMGCSLIGAKPTAAASQALPPVSTTDYVSGPENAPVTLLAYCDFQSAQCEIFNRVLDQLHKDHPNDMRVVLRPYPVPTSVVATLDKSQLSAQAAIAAGSQGKFWEMRALLHGQYEAWTKLSPEAFQTWIVGQASSMGLDPARFKEDLTSSDTTNRVASMYSEASKLGIAAIPTVFINGALQQRPAMSYDGLNTTIGLVALGDRQFSTCPPFRIDPNKRYTATLHTERGDIVIQLYPEEAPLAVNSFVFLAEHGWYNGVTFHRVIPGFVAQAGDPSGTGAGGPGYYFKNEVSSLRFDKPGVVGMANAGPDTNGSQFFITYAPAAQLDGTYTIFGQVTKGMDVVESLTQRDPQSTPGLPQGDKINSVTIEER